MCFKLELCIVLNLTLIYVRFFLASNLVFKVTADELNSSFNIFRIYRLLFSIQ